MQDAAADFPRLLARAQRLARLAAHFAQPATADAARWLEVGLYTLQLTESPLDIAQTVRERLLGIAPPDSSDSSDSPAPPEGLPPSPEAAQGQPPFAAVGEEDPFAPSAAPAAPRAWVFVSATLGDDAQLTWFTRQLRSEERRVGKECRSRWSPYH